MFTYFSLGRPLCVGVCQCSGIWFREDNDHQWPSMTNLFDILDLMWMLAVAESKRFPFCSSPSSSMRFTLPELKGSFWITTTEVEKSRPVAGFSGHWFNQSSHSSRMPWRSTWRYWGAKNCKREKRGERERERKKKRISARIAFQLCRTWTQWHPGIMSNVVSVTCFDMLCISHKPFPRSSWFQMDAMWFCTVVRYQVYRLVNWPIAMPGDDMGMRTQIW